MAGTALRGDEPEALVGDDVGPRQGRALPGGEAHDVLATVGREPADAVVEPQQLVVARARRCSGASRPVTRRSAGVGGYRLRRRTAGWPVRRRLRLDERHDRRRRGMAFRHRQGGLARIGEPETEGQRPARARRHFQDPAQTKDRIQHVAGRARQRALQRQRRGRRQRPATTDEAVAVGLAGERQLRRRLLLDQPVRQPPAPLVGAARAPAREQRPPLRHRLGLHEQLGEGRMSGIRGARLQHHLEIARDLEAPRPGRGVLDAAVADLAGLVRCDRDRQRGEDVLLDAQDLDAPGREVHLVVVGIAAARLVAERPEPARIKIAQVDEVAVAVLDRVGPPAGQRDVVAFGVAAAGVGDQRRVAAIGEGLQVRSGLRQPQPVEAGRLRLWRCRGAPRSSRPPAQLSRPSSAPRPCPWRLGSGLCGPRSSATAGRSA